MAGPPPIALSIHVCDQVSIDQFSGKATIIGSFEFVGAPGFPASNPNLTVFAELVEGRGTVKATCRVVRTTAESA